MFLDIEKFGLSDRNRNIFWMKLVLNAIKICFLKRKLYKKLEKKKKHLTKNKR